MNKYLNAIKSSPIGWSTLVTGFAFCSYFLVSLVAILPASFALILEDGEATFNAVASISFPVLTIIAGLLFARLLYGKREDIFDVLGWRLPNKKAWWLIPVVTIIYFFCLIIVTMILSAASPELAEQEQEVAKITQSLGGLRLFFMVVGVGILTPIAEETFFRGLIFSLFKKKLRVGMAILMTAILFSLAHWQVNVSLDTFVFGIALGILTWQTKSIYPAIFLHMLKNCLALSVILS